MHSTKHVTYSALLNKDKMEFNLGMGLFKQWQFQLLANLVVKHFMKIQCLDTLNYVTKVYDELR